MLWYHDKPPAVGLFAFSLYQLPMAAQWLSCAVQGDSPTLHCNSAWRAPAAAGGAGENILKPQELDDSKIL